VVEVTNVIIRVCAKFCEKNIQEYDATGGWVKIRHFPLTLAVTVLLSHGMAVTTVQTVIVIHIHVRQYSFCISFIKETLKDVLHDDSGTEAIKLGTLFAGIPATDGDGPSRPYIARTASVCATHADGSIGLTGSCRGDK